MTAEPMEQTHQEKSVPVWDASVCARARSAEDFLGAALLVDKPGGWTSYDVIRRLKRYFPRATKIGHTGTLDPLATGLLILLFGRATKSQGRFLRLPKVYDGTMRLGEVTPSMDSATEVTLRKPIGSLTFAQIESACSVHTGGIQQIPPMYSAVKVGGERLYKKARRGESVERSPNEVTIHSFKVLRVEGAEVHFRVRCSKGTYIRVLAHDVGQHLHVGAHLTQLRRTAIGSYQVERACSVEQLVAVLENI
ncbi:MAG: tRNA pseudouridine(55) synthase TruB [Bacteroidota bacterium]|nr:tRNA pseudouridine(55) synthase TruB [Bacteroidota bacterium]MDE2645847.1 tRNA pseudouridine(55) synthase TruB [Bacteroidota bacterium]